MTTPNLAPAAVLRALADRLDGARESMLSQDADTRRVRGMAFVADLDPAVVRGAADALDAHPDAAAVRQAFVEGWTVGHSIGIDSHSGRGWERDAADRATAAQAWEESDAKAAPTAPNAAHPDAARLDWLEAEGRRRCMHIESHPPMGLRTDWTWDVFGQGIGSTPRADTLRAAIDAAMGAAAPAPPDDETPETIATRTRQYEACVAALVERATAPDASPPDESVRDLALRAFVKGAKWWEYTSTGATMWPSGQHRAYDEAEKRWPARFLSPVERAELAADAAAATPPAPDAAPLVHPAVRYRGTDACECPAPSQLYRSQGNARLACSACGAWVEPAPDAPTVTPPAARLGAERRKEIAAHATWMEWCARAQEPPRLAPDGANALAMAIQDALGALTAAEAERDALRTAANIAPGASHAFAIANLASLTSDYRRAVARVEAAEEQLADVTRAHAAAETDAPDAPARLGADPDVRAAVERLNEFLAAHCTDGPVCLAPHDAVDVLEDALAAAEAERDAARTQLAEQWGVVEALRRAAANAEQRTMRERSDALSEAQQACAALEAQLATWREAWESLRQVTGCDADTPLAWRVRELVAEVAAEAEQGVKGAQLAVRRVSLVALALRNAAERDALHAENDRMQATFVNLNLDADRLREQLAARTRATAETPSADRALAVLLDIAVEIDASYSHNRPIQDHNTAGLLAHCMETLQGAFAAAEAERDALLTALAGVGITPSDEDDPDDRSWIILTEPDLSVCPSLDEALGLYGTLWGNEIAIAAGCPMDQTGALLVDVVTHVAGLRARAETAEAERDASHTQLAREYAARRAQEHRTSCATTDLHRLVSAIADAHGGADGIRHAEELHGMHILVLEDGERMVREIVARAKAVEARAETAEANARAAQTVVQATRTLREEAALAAFARSESRAETLAAALTEVTTVFEGYAALHYAKGTPEGNSKAMANLAYAAACRDALSLVPRPAAAPDAPLTPPAPAEEA